MPPIAVEVGVIAELVILDPLSIVEDAIDMSMLSIWWLIDWNLICSLN